MKMEQSQKSTGKVKGYNIVTPGEQHWARIYHDDQKGFIKA